MAYVNGEFNHEIYEIEISVLEPTRDENDFNEGMKIMVDWDSFVDLTLEDFRHVIKWMNDKADYIEKHFDKKGKKIKL